MGRPKDPNSRRSRAERKRQKRAEEAAARLAQKGEPNAQIQKLRETYSFVRAEKGGMIDRDIHDAIGKLWALGYLDDHGHDPKELVAVGRDYAELYWERYSATAPKTGGYERRSPGTGEPPPRTSRDDRFDRLDSALSRVSMERTAIHMLLTNHFHSDKTEGWVQRLINRALVERGVSDVLVFFDSATEGHDRYMLGCAIRGLSQLMDASLPSRYQRRAA